MCVLFDCRQGKLFGIGIRYIVDALRQPTNNKIFAFGIAALDQFKYKLKEVPKLCEYVMSLPNFSEFPPYLVEVSVFFLIELSSPLFLNI